MKRNEPCSHLRPDYDRMELAHYIYRDAETDEISWEPSTMELELMRLGLVAMQEREKRMDEMSV